MTIATIIKCSKCENDDQFSGLMDRERLALEGWFISKDEVTQLCKECVRIFEELADYQFEISTTYKKLKNYEAPDPKERRSTLDMVPEEPLDPNKKYETVKIFECRFKGYKIENGWSEGEICDVYVKKLPTDHENYQSNMNRIHNHEKNNHPEMYKKFVMKHGGKAPIRTPMVRTIPKED